MANIYEDQELAGASGDPGTDPYMAQSDLQMAMPSGEEDALDRQDQLNDLQSQIAQLRQASATGPPDQVVPAPGQEGYQSPPQAAPPAPSPQQQQPQAWVQPTGAPAKGGGQWASTPVFGLDMTPEAAPEADQGYGSEIVGGLARSGAGMLKDMSGLVATAMRKTGDWTDEKWLNEGADAIDNFTEGVKKAADENYSLGTMSMKDAWNKRVIGPWIAGKAVEQVLPVGTLLAAARLSPYIPIIYGALVAMNDESKKPDATPESIVAAGSWGAGLMGLPIGVAKAAAGRSLIQKLAIGAAGFGAIGGVGTLQEPTTRAVAGEPFQPPDVATVGQGIVTGALGAPLAAFPGAKEGEPTPKPTGGEASDPAVAAATQLALPPPSPENRPQLPSPIDPNQPRLPPPSPENRPPPDTAMNVPPTGPEQVSRSDIIPPQAGTVEYPGTGPGISVTAPDSFRPGAQPSRTGDPAMDAALEITLPAAEPTPPGDRSAPTQPPVPPNPTPPAQPLDRTLPTMPAPDQFAPGARVPRGQRPPVVEPTKPDVVEPTKPDVVEPTAPGETPPAPELAAATTGSEAPPAPEPTPPPGDASAPTQPPLPPAPTPPLTPAQQARATRRAQMKPAAQAVLAAADQQAAPKPQPAGLVRLLKRGAQAAQATPGEAPSNVPAAAQLPKPAPTPQEQQEEPAPRAAVAPVEAPPEPAPATAEPPAPPAQPTPRQAIAAGLKAAGWQDMGTRGGIQTLQQPRSGAQLTINGRGEVNAYAKGAQAPFKWSDQTTREAIQRGREVLAKQQAGEEQARVQSLSAQVKGEFATARRPPARAAEPARGMEDIGQVAEGATAPDEVAPTRTAAPVKTTAEAEGRTPDTELKSDVRAASTTDKVAQGRDLLHDILEQPDKMTPLQAFDRYGRQPAGAGNRRTFENFADFLDDRIKQAEDPKRLEGLVAEANRINDSKMSVKVKQAAADKIGKQIEDLATEQDRLEEMKAIREGLARDLTARGDVLTPPEPGKPARTRTVEEPSAAAQAKSDAAFERMAAEVAARRVAKGGKKPLGMSAGYNPEWLREITAEERAFDQPPDIEYRTQGLRDAAKDPSVNQPIVDRIAASKANGVAYDLHDYLNDIIGNNAARALARHAVRAAEALKRILPRGIKTYSEERGTLDDDALGHYDRDADEVVLSEKLPSNSPRSHAEMVIHEATHAATAHWLDDIKAKLDLGEPVDPADQRRYEALVEVNRELARIKTADMTSSEAMARDYAISSLESGDAPHELVSGAFSDPRLYGLMARRAVSPELKAALTRLGYGEAAQKRSVWDAFKRIVRGIFGLKPTDDNLLEWAMRPVTDVISRGAEYRPEGLAARQGARDQFFDDWARDREREASERGWLDKNASAISRGTLKITDTLPDEDLRNQLSSFGDRVMAMKRGLVDPDEAQSGLVSRVLNWVKNQKGGTLRTLNDIVLPGAPTNLIVMHNKDVLPQGEAIRDARAKMARVANDVGFQWGDRVKDWARQLTRSGDSFAQLRNDASMAEASLGRPDFEQANAHLKGDALDRARVLQDRFDALPEEQQNLYRDLRDYELERGWAERQAGYEHAIDLGLGDIVTDQQRAELARIARSMPKIEQVLNDPDASPIKQMFGDEWGKGAGAMVREIVKLQKTGFLRGDYTSLARQGDYIVSHGTPGEDNYGVHFFERNAQARQFVDAFRQAFPDVSVTEPKIKSTTGSGGQRFREFMPETSLASFEQALARRGITGERANDALDAYTGMMLQNATQTQAARFAMRRRNVIGASTEAAKNLQNDLYVHGQRMGYLLNGAAERRAYNDAQRHIDAMKRASAVRDATPDDIAAGQRRLDALEQRFANKDPTVSRDEVLDTRQRQEWLKNPPSSDDLIRAQQVLGELQARRTPIDGDNSSRFFGRAAKRFTGLSFVYHMMRPAHLAVQMADAWSNAQALMGAKYGHVRTAVALASALKDLAPTAMRAGGRNMLHSVWGELKATDWKMSDLLANRLIAKGMPEVEARALVDAANNYGLLDVSMERELQRMAHPGAFSFGGDAATRMGHVPGAMMDLFASAGHATDSMNRMAILKAAYDLAKRANGGKVEDAIKQAVDMAQTAMPNYNVWNKPRIATERGPFKNPMIAATMQYKIYGMQLYSVMGSLVRNAATRPGERAEAIKALAGLVATHSLLVGLTTSMFGATVNTLTGAWDWLRGAPGPHDYETDLRRWMTQNWGPGVSTFMSRGLLGSLGIDLHRSLKLGNMLELPEIKSFDRAGIGAAIATALTGATGELAEQLGQGVHDMMSGGNVQKGILELTPRVPADIIKSYQLSHLGLTDSRGTVIAPAAQLSPSTPILRALGFNPTETSIIYDRRRAEQQWEQEVGAARQAAEDRFVQSRDMSLVRAFNANRDLNQGYVITAQDLQTAVKRQQGKSATPGTYGLAVPKKRLPGALAAGRFS